MNEKMPSPAGIKAARTAIAVILSLTAYMFVFGLPWNNLGLWRQVEIPTAILHLLCAMLIAPLSMLLIKDTGRALRFVLHPVILCLFALSLLSFVLLPFSESPWRSLHGTLKHGIGALWHLELAIVTLCAAIVLNSRQRLVLEANLVISSAALVTMHALPAEALIGWPLAFAEWVGIYAALVAFVVIFPRRSLRSTKRTVIGISLLIAGLLVSENRAVALAAFASSIVFAAWWFVPALRRALGGLDYRSQRIRTMSVVTAGALGIVAMTAIGPILEKAALSQAPAPNSERVLSQDPLDKRALQEGALGTLWSRGNMVVMSLKHLAEDPIKLVTGFGWGGFATVYEHHARDVPGRAFPKALASSSQTYWDAQQNADFHSHNLAIETLLSVGVIGLCLWFACIAFLAKSGLSGAALSVGIFIGGLFWFPVNFMTIAIASALACTLKPRPISVVHLNIGVLLSLLLAPFIFIMLLMSSLLIGGLSVIEYGGRHFAPATAMAGMENCEPISTILLPEDEVNISLYELFQQHIIRADDPKAKLKELSSNLAGLSCAMRKYAAHDNGLLALVTSLEKRATFIALSKDAVAPLYKDITNWGHDVDRLLVMAPDRTEHVVPYLTTLIAMAHNKALVADELRKYAEKISPDDPVGLYVRALERRFDGDEAGYIDMFRKATKAGYANIFPITDRVAQELKL